jgi:pimeloyl-ACP methyl ester carboxylesterase
MPILLLRGTETPPEVLVATDELTAELPSAGVVVMEGQGHMAMWTAPAEFVRRVEEFLLES